MAILRTAIREGTTGHASELTRCTFRLPWPLHCIFNRLQVNSQKRCEVGAIRSIVCREYSGLFAPGPLIKRRSSSALIDSSLPGA